MCFEYCLHSVSSTFVRQQTLHGHVSNILRTNEHCTNMHGILGNIFRAHDTSCMSTNVTLEQRCFEFLQTNQLAQTIGCAALAFCARLQLTQLKILHVHNSFNLKTTANSFFVKWRVKQWKPAARFIQIDPNVMIHRWLVSILEGFWCRSGVNWVSVGMVIRSKQLDVFSGGSRTESYSLPTWAAGTKARWAQLSAFSGWYSRWRY